MLNRNYLSLCLYLSVGRLILVKSSFPLSLLDVQMNIELLSTFQQNYPEEFDGTLDCASMAVCCAFNKIGKRSFFCQSNFHFLVHRISRFNVSSRLFRWSTCNLGFSHSWYC